MLGKVSIALRAEPNEVAVGVPTEVRVHVRNDSAAGLKSVRISTRPDVGSGDIPYLAEAASVSVPLTIHASTSAQPLRIAVHWIGYRLDGTLARGEEIIEILVRSTREVVRAGDLGASPYIVGNPIDREEMFFGRADVIDRIRRQLAATTNANIVLLEGNRRTGKTSVLKQLQKKGTLPGWLIVYCNFQEAEGDPTRAGISTRDVYRFLARTIGWTLFAAGIRTWFPGQPPPDGKRAFPTEFLSARDRAITDDHPFESFELYLSAALEAARPQRVLLMLDEFDKLQEGIDARVTSPQVPENIRHILQHHQGLSAILTGSRRLKRLREEYWSALFGLGYRIGISSLSMEDAQRLVTEPVAGRLNYLPQARDRVVALCAQQPFLVQALCNRIFERAASSGERAITVAAVEEAAVEMVRENEHFRTLWGYAQTHRRRLLLALCERLAEGPDAVTLDFLSTRLEADGVHVPRQTLLGDDLEYLRELELIELDKAYRGGTYRIAVPLLGLWIRTSIDFDDAVARAREEALEAHP
jgi:type I restriction enzyme M protein